MPTTYTHDIFGKEVYKRLPSEIKEAIRESKSMYLIGLHGPDILFYYQPLMKNRVSGLGHQVHQREAAEFFCQAVVKYQEEPTCADVILSAGIWMPLHFGQRLPSLCTAV